MFFRASLLPFGFVAGLTALLLAMQLVARIEDDASPRPLTYLALRP